MFKNRLGKTPNNLTDQDFDNLGESTEGFSGSDISVIVKDAMMEPVRRCQVAQKFIKTPDGFYVPTFPSDPNGIAMNLMQADPAKVKAPDISSDDFYKSLGKIKPSVAPSDLLR